MSTANFGFKSGDQLSKKSIVIWRIVQTAVWLVGATILSCLLFFPKIGLLLFWNILIPVAPLLFVVAVGIWRNICPLATTNLLPRQLGLSKQKKLSATQLGKLNLIAVIALYVIVPLRHAVLNNNGVATGLMIVAMAAIGITLGFFYEWKSAWCSGLCPVHPVEKLYGGNVLLAIPNANCSQCMNCVIPCPDSTPNINPKITAKTIYHKLSGLLIIGGLPGFIWGWFHVPDEHEITSIATFFGVYEIPLSGFAITWVAYLILSNVLDVKYERRLISIFAAAGVSCYYWYRIPSLIGFGKFPDDGLLINLSNALPVWIVPVLNTITTAFFFYWLVIRKKNNRSWVIRPEFGHLNKKTEATLSA
jgi:NAD-dependent dihydropyrimidine dehydrogenase PreA subunit